MSGSNFLQALLTFPKDTINDETVELLEPYLSMEDFNIEQVTMDSQWDSQQRLELESEILFMAEFFS